MTTCRTMIINCKFTLNSIQTARFHLKEKHLPQWITCFEAYIRKKKARGLFVIINVFTTILQVLQPEEAINTSVRQQLYA